jgi:hypothetical protein
LYSPPGSVPSHFHLSTCIPIKSNLYLIVLIKLSLGSPPYTDSLRSMFQTSYPHSVIYVIYPKNPSRSKVLLNISQQAHIFMSPTPKLKDQPFSAVHGCLFNVFTATLNSQRPSFHPQPENVPCYGDKLPI